MPVIQKHGDDSHLAPFRWGLDRCDGQGHPCRGGEKEQGVARYDEPTRWSTEDRRLIQIHLSDEMAPHDVHR